MWALIKICLSSRSWKERDFALIAAVAFVVKDPNCVDELCLSQLLKNYNSELPVVSKSAEGPQ